MFSAIKLTLNDEVRRITASDAVVSYSSLIEISNRLFPVLVHHPSPLMFAWIDDEGDRIVCSSDEEVEEAMRVMYIQNKAAIHFEIIATGLTSSDKAAVKSIHPSVACDDCGMFPIVGFRYKCTVRNDFDLCSCCEAKQVQPYAMIKIYSSEQPAKFVVVSTKVNESSQAMPRNSFRNSGCPYAWNQNCHTNKWKYRGDCHRGGCEWKPCGGCRSDGPQQVDWNKFADISRTAADLVQDHMAKFAGAMQQECANKEGTAVGVQPFIDIIHAFAESLNQQSQPAGEDQASKEHSDASTPSTNETTSATSAPTTEHAESSPNVAFPQMMEAVWKDDDLDLWRTELSELASMGFDDVIKALPLLRKFCSPPVSQQPAGAVPYADGLRRVVNYLLV